MTDINIQTPTGEAPEGKEWWHSKTLWFNGIMAAVVAFFAAVGTPLDEGVVAAIMTLGNLILRLITKEPITVSTKLTVIPRFKK